MEIKLSKRETEVAELLTEGKFPKNIADELNIKVSTVRDYIQSLHKKLGTKSLHQLVLVYRMNFPSPPDPDSN
jgi:DNA-binding NarL/FixJ family response regulator